VMKGNAVDIRAEAMSSIRTLGGGHRDRDHMM
jgi:hypothetical protein